MDLAVLVKGALQASIAMTVVSLGMQARFADVLAFLAAPRRVFSSLAAVLIVMPVFAVVCVLLTDLPPPVKLALVALSVSPIPPLLPRKQMKAGGEAGYVFGLLVAVAMASIVFVPAAIEGIERVFGIPLQMSAIGVAKIVFVSVLAPLSAGMLIGALTPSIAGKIARPLGHLATGLLVVAAAMILVKAGPGMLSLLGGGTVLAFIGFTVVGLAAGHLLGGPADGDRGTLAIATATRHPGVALAIAAVNFPDQKLALPAVLIYMLVGIVLSIPYMKWLERKAGSDETARAGATG